VLIQTVDGILLASMRRRGGDREMDAQAQSRRASARRDDRHDGEQPGRAAALGNQAMLSLLRGGSGRRDGSAPITADPPRAAPQELAAGVSRLVGSDVRDVPLHSGPHADALTDRHGAFAVVEGRSIALARDVSLDTLAGQAIVAHELAHAAANDGSSAGFTGVLDQEAAEEDYADRVAAGALAPRFGLRVGGAGGKGRPGLGLRACKRGSELSTPQQTAATGALRDVAGGTPIIHRAVQDAYGGSDLPNLRADAVPSGLLAETKGSVTAMPSSSLGLSSPRLGALLIHESSHMRDPTNFMGAADQYEGYAYAFELTTLQRSLARMAPGDPARADVEARIRLIEGLRSSPPTLPVFVPAYQDNFDSMTLTLQLLYRVVDGVPSTWGPSGAPPGWSTLTSTTAQDAIVALLRTDSDQLRTGSQFERQLLVWVSAHVTELRAVLAAASPPASPPSSHPTTTTTPGR
jgi:hypothetical protein